MAADSILNILLNVCDGLVVYPQGHPRPGDGRAALYGHRDHFDEGSEKGGDRQELHERLRRHAVAAAAQVKEEGLPNDMIRQVEADPAFGLSARRSRPSCGPRPYRPQRPSGGRIFETVIAPVLAAHPEAAAQHAELEV